MSQLSKWIRELLSDGRYPCPHCGTPIKREARICYACRSRDLDTANPPR